MLHFIFFCISCINKIEKRTDELSNRSEILLEFIVSWQSYCTRSFVAARDTDAIEERARERKRKRIVFACVGVRPHRERDVGH